MAGGNDPVPGDRGAHGRFGARTRSRSRELWATLHRRSLALAAGGAAALATAALRR